MSRIKSVIESLGYSNSNMLYYYDSVDMQSHRAVVKLFEAFAPTAVYLVDNKPFIVFYESLESKIDSQVIIKVWNAQIPLLIVSYQDRLEVFNGCSLDLKKNLIMLESMDYNHVNEFSHFSFWNISNPLSWKNYEKKLSAPKLDEILLDNIREATSLLRKSKCAPFAVKIILRLLFIRYLIDRGIDLDYFGLTSNVKDSQIYLLIVLQDKKKLYNLFTHLKNRFNGNLFELYEAEQHSECDIIDVASLNILHDLMAGDLVLSSGQTSLFPLYDFNIIPVELISNIYERFLGDKAQKEDKAFYTPPYLVDYLLKQTVTTFLDKNRTCRILDPACGSGIFLVEAARKLIERNILYDSMNFSDRKLVEVVTENLWGIDKNPEAVDVAIFSIYLTILDYKDPKTLRDFELPYLKNTNFFVCDFFSDKATRYLKGKRFDFIIGNPPWGSVNGPHVKYCEDRDLPIHRKEISRSFILRTEDFANASTCCCLIVTSKLFYNSKSPSVAFRRRLLEKTKVAKYVELAAVREIIFTKARGPAGVIMYQFNNNCEDNKKHELCHLTLKPNIYFKLFNIIAIEKNDYKYVPQSLLLDNDWAWKTLVFGYTQDFATINSLLKKHKTVKQVINEYAFRDGTGIRYADGDKQDADHLIGHWLINAENGIKSYEVIIENGQKFTKKKIHRAKKDKMYLFSSPYALLKKGFNTQNYRVRAAYSEEDFLYTDAITGICGEESNKKVLQSLVGLFNSSFFSYLNLMLGSSSGIEREQGFPTQIFSYPVIIDEQIADLVVLIERALKNERSAICSSSESKDLINKLDELILDKLDLANDTFVNYALDIQIPLVAKNKVYWEVVSSDQLYNYAKIFTEYFNTIFDRSDKYISANIFKGIAGHYCAVEFVFLDSTPEKIINEHDNTKDNQINFLSKFMLNKVNDLFYEIKDVISFSKNSFYILKTQENKNWHPAMAKLDLADVITSIVNGNEVHES